jgi:hypothetical protein
MLLRSPPYRTLLATVFLTASTALSVAQNSTLKVTPYVDGGYTRTEDKRDSSPSVTESWQLTAGFDLAVTSWLEIGGGGTFGEGDSRFGAGPVINSTDPLFPGTSQVLGGDADSESWTVFGRTTVTLPNNFSLGAIAGYTETDTRETRESVLRGPNGANAVDQSWTRDSDTAFVGGNIAYTHRWTQWFAVPSARILYTNTHSGSYNVFTTIDGPGLLNTSQVAQAEASDDDLLRGQLGSDIGYFFQSGTAYFVPIFRAYWVHDFDLPEGFRDRDAADLAASLNYIDGGLTIGGEFQTTVGRDETETYGGRGYLLYKF